MKTMTIKTITVISVFFVLMALCSCTDVLAPGNNDDFDTDTVLVTLSIELSADSGPELSRVLDSQRTFLPALPSGNYTLKLSNPEKGIYDVNVNLSSPSYTAAINLVTGNWEAVVTWNKAGVSTPVVLGTASFTVSAGVNNITLDVYRVEGGTGLFSYTINLSGISASATLVMQDKNGAQYVRTFNISAGTSPGGIIPDLPSGDYDVFVSLLAADGRSAGAYSAANIYPGLETTGSFSFGSGHFVPNINLAGKTVTFTGSTSVAWSSAKITAYSTVENTIPIGTPQTITPGGEWIVRVPYDVSTVYLTLELTGSDGLKYLKKNALVQNMSEVGTNGKENISLPIAIYTINGGTPLTSGANSVTPARYTASPGETINLDIFSTYGLRAGTLRAFCVPESQYIPVTGSGDSYAFTMPEGNVNLSLTSPNFLTADLAGGAPSVKRNISIDVSLTKPDPNVDVFEATVANSVTSVTVTATPIPAELLDVDVSVFGPVSALSTGVNEITVVVTPTAEGGKGSRVYTILLTRQASTVDTLSNLVVSQVNLSPVFSPGTTSYTATVPHNVTSVDIYATPTDSAASVSGDIGNQALGVGINTFTVVVTPEIGSEKNYIITITREYNTDLQSLSLSEGTMAPTFSPSTTHYTVSGVQYSVAAVNVTAAAGDSNATVNVSKGGTSYVNGIGIPVAVGDNTIIVTVTNYTYVKTYTIVVNKNKNNDSTLTALSVVTDSGTTTTLNPADTANPPVNVSYAVRSVTINATAAADGTVNGMSSAAIPCNNLAVGNNLFYLTSVAQDGTTKIYTVTINRLAPVQADSYLTDINLSTGSFWDTANPLNVGEFSSTVYSYEVEVPNDGTLAVNIDVIKTREWATVLVTGSYASVQDNGTYYSIYGIPVGSTIIVTVIVEGGTVNQKMSQYTFNIVQGL